MCFPKQYTFSWTGYDAYYDSIMPAIEPILCDALEDPEEHYLIAVNEAICNAARYALDGPEQAKIHLQILMNTTDIKTSISSVTTPWDAISFRQHLRSLADSPETGRLDWGDYTGTTAMSRGYWIMLMACDYIVTDSHGQRITLCARRPFRSWHVRKTIQNLVPRLYLEKKGVIF